MMDAASPAALVGHTTQPAGRHVDVRHIWKAYTPGNFVVRDVTFTLQPGEFLTLLGPSGSGKTSTLMMVAGFETPSEGEIHVDGKVFNAQTSPDATSQEFTLGDALPARWRLRLRSGGC